MNIVIYSHEKETRSVYTGDTARRIEGGKLVIVEKPLGDLMLKLAARDKIDWSQESPAERTTRLDAEAKAKADAEAKAAAEAATTPPPMVEPPKTAVAQTAQAAPKPSADGKGLGATVKNFFGGAK